MSKATPSNAEVEATIKALRGDFAGITGFIAGEFVKIAKANDGVVDITNPAFAEAAESLINADPRVINSEENVAARGSHSAVLSFTGTKQGIEEKIDKLIAKGADPERFTSLREDLDQLETDLRTQIASSEGIQELVKQKLTKDLAGDQITFLVPNKSGELQGLPMDQKKDLTTKISDNIQLNDKNTAALLSADTETLAWINSSTNQLISSTLGSADNHFVLDESKLTPGNLEKIGQEISNVISQASLVNDIAQSIENESGLKVSNERKAKILQDIAPALAQLDPEYVEKNRATIVSDLSKELYSKRTTMGRARGQLRVSQQNRGKIAETIIQNHLKKSEAFGVEKVSNEFTRQQLSNTEIAKRLNEFSVENGTPERYTASTIPDDAVIAGIRKNNPKLFDQLVLKTDPAKEVDEVRRDAEPKKPTRPVPQLPEQESRKMPPSQYAAAPRRPSPTHGKLPEGPSGARIQYESLSEVAQTREQLNAQAKATRDAALAGKKPTRIDRPLPPTPTDRRTPSQSAAQKKPSPTHGKLPEGPSGATIQYGSLAEVDQTREQLNAQAKATRDAALAGKKPTGLDRPSPPIPTDRRAPSQSAAQKKPSPTHGKLPEGPSGATIQYGSLAEVDQTREQLNAQAKAELQAAIKSAPTKPARPAPTRGEPKLKNHHHKLPSREEMEMPDKGEREAAVKQLIDETVKTFERTHKQQITPKTEARITNALKKELTKLPLKTILGKTPEIATEVSNSMSKKRTFLSRFSRKFDISDKDLSKLTKEVATGVDSINQSQKQEFPPKRPLPPVPGELRQAVQTNMQRGAKTQPTTPTAAGRTGQDAGKGR